MALPLLALTQGDPAGIGPEILLKVASRWAEEPRPAWRPLLVAEKSALTPLRDVLPGVPWDRLAYLSAPPAESDLPEGMIPVLDPVPETSVVIPARALNELTRVLADAYFPLASPACAALESVTIRQIRDQLVTAGLATDQDIDHHLENVTSGALARHVEDPRFLQ